MNPQVTNPATSDTSPTWPPAPTNEQIPSPPPAPLDTPTTSTEVLPPTPAVLKPPPQPSVPQVTAPTKPPKPNIIKKILFPLLAFIALVVGAYLVYTQIIQPRLTTPEPETITLTYWGLWEPQEVIQPLINQYQVDHPNVQITYLKQSPQNYRERLQSAIQRGEGPDIFRFHATWTPMLQEQLSPLPPELASVQQFEQYFPVAKDLLFYQSRSLGIPLMYDGLALLINDTVLENAEPPATWEEFRLLAHNLTQYDPETNRITYAGAAFGTTNNISHWSDIIGLLLLQSGIDLANPHAVVDARGRNIGADALTFYTNFVLADRIWDAGLPQDYLAFANNQVGMIFAPSWRILEIQQINPQLQFSSYPVPQSGSQSITWASFWAEGISSASSNQAAAAEFLQFLTSSSVLQTFYTEAAKLRGFGEIYPLKDLAQELSSNRFLSGYIQDAPQAESWYLASFTHDNGLNDKIIKYYEDAINAINQGGDPEDVLLTVSQGVNQVLTQYSVSQ